MPLFRCSKCDCVENTALGEYWGRPEKPLCSECSEIRGNRWHGQFPKEEYDQEKWRFERVCSNFITPRRPT